jgi:hypothetical protein
MILVPKIEFEHWYPVKAEKITDKDYRLSYAPSIAKIMGIESWNVDIHEIKHYYRKACWLDGLFHPSASFLLEQERGSGQEEHTPAPAISDSFSTKEKKHDS